MRHCLIVDDSDIIRRVAKKVLEELNIMSGEAEDADQALKFCRRAMPDLILLDWQMPKMPPHEFMTAVRREPHGDHPIIVYCTTENDPADIAKARKLGANDILMKPFDKELVQRVLGNTGFGLD